MNQGPVARLAAHVMRRADATVREALRRGLALVTDPALLAVEHLFLALLTLDPSVVFRKLRGTGADPRLAVEDVRRAADARGKGDPAAVLTVLRLLARMAPVGSPLRSEHLLFAILLEGTNAVAARVRARIEPVRLARRRFLYLGAAADALAARAHVLRPAEGGAGLSRALGAALHRASERAESPEGRARRWLAELIADQADCYAANDFVEVRSHLDAAREYRIHRRGRTEIYQAGRPVAAGRIGRVAPSILPTERVIAEYFLIRDDERRWLATARIAPA